MTAITLEESGERSFAPQFDPFADDDVVHGVSVSSKKMSSRDWWLEPSSTRFMSSMARRLSDRSHDSGAAMIGRGGMVMARLRRWRVRLRRPRSSDPAKLVAWLDEVQEPR